MTTLEQHLAAHGLYLDEMAEDCNVCGCGWRIDGDELDYSADNDTATQIAELHAAHVAATWQEARTVRTVEELDALPVGAVVLDCDGFKAERCPANDDCHWLPFGEEIDFPHDSIGLPALVAWTPEDSAA